MQVAILGISVTSSILRVLLSPFCVSGSQIASPRDPVPESWMSGSLFQDPQCQGPKSQSSWVPGPRAMDSGSQDPRVSSRSVPWSWVSGPDFRLCLQRHSRRVLSLRVLHPGSQILILGYAIYSRYEWKFLFFWCIQDTIKVKWK